MRSKLIQCAIAAFWAVMMFLLVRSEYGFGGGGMSGSISPEVVWEKMLTAQDTSSLEIFFRGKKVGMCRWASGVTHEDAPQSETAESLSNEGRVERVTGYTVELDGTVSMAAVTNTLRFSLGGGFGTNLGWSQWEVRLTLKPLQLELVGQMDSGAVTMNYDDGYRMTQRSFTREQLRRPDTILNDLAGPAAMFVAGQVRSTMAANGITNGPAASAVRWDAGFDWMDLGHGSLRVFLLRCRLGDNLQARIWVSRAGEILRAELPFQIVITNNELPRLKPRKA